MTGDVMDLLQYTFFQHAPLEVCWHCLWDYRYIYRNPPPGIYQRRNHSCFFRRDRVRIVCRNFSDTSAAVFSVLSAFGVQLKQTKDMREDSACSILDVRDGTRNYVQLPVTGICARPVGLPLRQYTDHQPNRLMDARHIGTHTDRILLSVYPPYRIYCL